MVNDSLTIVLIPLISTIVNGTLLNFGKRYEDHLMVIFDQWPKLHLGLDALSNKKILNGIWYVNAVNVQIGYVSNATFDLITYINTAQGVNRAESTRYLLLFYPKQCLRYYIIQ